MSEHAGDACIDFAIGMAMNERARILAIIQTIRAGHTAIFEHAIVEALDNIIDLIEDGK